MITGMGFAAMAEKLRRAVWVWEMVVLGVMMAGLATMRFRCEILRASMSTWDEMKKDESGTPRIQVYREYICWHTGFA